MYISERIREDDFRQTWIYKRLKMKDSPIKFEWNDYCPDTDTIYVQKKLPTQHELAIKLILYPTNLLDSIILHPLSSYISMTLKPHKKIDPITIQYGNNLQKEVVIDSNNISKLSDYLAIYTFKIKKPNGGIFKFDHSLLFNENLMLTEKTLDDLKAGLLSETNLPTITTSRPIQAMIPEIYYEKDGYDFYENPDPKKKHVDSIVNYANVEYTYMPIIDSMSVNNK